MSGRFILALDGSTEICTVALLAHRDEPRPEGGSVHSSWSVAERRSHSDGRSQARVLLHLIDDMLREAGGEPADLGAIVVGTGPGTFTGVRITVATGRALALGLSIPVFGVSTLSALAAAAAAAEEGPAESGLSMLIPVVDARRGQVFFGAYLREDAGGKVRWVRKEPYGVCDRSELVTVAQALTARVAGARGLGPGTFIVGDPRVLPDEHAGREGKGEGAGGIGWAPALVGAEWLVEGQAQLAEPGDGPTGTLLDERLRGALLAGRAAEAGDRDPGSPGSPESVKPIYVRAPDADIHITKMRDPWGAR